MNNDDRRVEQELNIKQGKLAEEQLEAITIKELKEAVGK